MTDGLAAHLHELLPATGRPPAARIEVGILAYAILRARYQPEAAPPENPYLARPVSVSLIGVPLVMSGGMDPAAWRILDRDGNVIKEGAL